MWDHDTVIAHLRFFSAASASELDVREADYVLALKILDKTSDVHKDIRFLLRKLREEKAARAEIKSIPLRNRKKQ